MHLGGFQVCFVDKKSRRRRNGDVVACGVVWDKIWIEEFEFRWFRIGCGRWKVHSLPHILCITRGKNLLIWWQLFDRLLNVIVCVLASSSLLAHLNVRYSLSTTPLKIVFISGMPDPIAWKAANFESQNLSNLFCLISNCSWLLLGITWGATTCTNPVENRTRNTGRETCGYFW